MNASAIAYPAVLLLAAYLIGSIPFSWIVARAFKSVDIRSVGSGNVGATNVLRSVGKRAGFLALFLDGLKGWGVVFLATVVSNAEVWPFGLDGTTVLDSPSFWIGLSAVVVTLGHMFPVWLRFRGGKGVATGAGAYLGIDPVALVFTFVTFVVILTVVRYVSIASMAAAAVFPLYLRFITGGTTWEIVFSVAIGLLVIIKHHTNVARILSGEEERFP